MFFRTDGHSSVVYMYHIDYWFCDVHLVQHSMTDDFMDGWRDGIQEWIHTHTACIHITNYTIYYMYIHVICVCCASNQWVLTDGSHGMDGWGSLQKNHVCLSVGSLPWFGYCKSPLVKQFSLPKSSINHCHHRRHDGCRGGLLQH